MKKTLISCVAVTALMTSVQADFSFGDMFKDINKLLFQ